METFWIYDGDQLTNLRVSLSFFNLFMVVDAYNCLIDNFLLIDSS
jgi:hypothetical protein